ncbi:unnamed protein product [Lactuca virosa]|uniref:Uncharacterized protein n=1 Tax=Lactuca virosa TaxID=75947 RepID=A0AAU9N4L5_9ASTR|nr:unnamed protein product [Lactuca virosa]
MEEKEREKEGLLEHPRVTRLPKTPDGELVSTPLMMLCADLNPTHRTFNDFYKTLFRFLIDADATRGFGLLINSEIYEQGVISIGC